MQPAPANLLEIKNLRVSFHVEGTTFQAVRGIDLSVAAGKTLGIVGESGCGKSVTSLSVIRLIPEPPGRTEGSVIFEGKELLNLPLGQMRKIRGNQISMIFQEPMTALNPVFRVGDQIQEVYELHQGLSSKEAKSRAIEMLKAVGIPSPERRYHEYPHQLSGGMRQRVMIAMALACKPKLLIADEPTTALDVTIQAQILDLMKSLKSNLGTSILLITHDLGVVLEMCDEVVVMYAGKVVEQASCEELFRAPKHPYTHGLLASKVSVDYPRDRALKTISGTVPNLSQLPMGCTFQDRCSLAKDSCKLTEPPLEEKTPGHHVACFEVRT